MGQVKNMKRKCDKIVTKVDKLTLFQRSPFCQKGPAILRKNSWSGTPTFLFLLELFFGVFDHI